MLIAWIKIAKTGLRKKKRTLGNLALKQCLRKTYNKSLMVKKLMKIISLDAILITFSEIQITLKSFSTLQPTWTTEKTSSSTKTKMNLTTLPRVT